MKYLLDTHILLWTLVDNNQLPKIAKEIIIDNNNEIYFSTISPWEIEIKHLRKPEEISVNCSKLCHICEQNYINNLKIENKHIYELKNIKPVNTHVKHIDSFDKMLLAQAISENLLLITHDKKFNNYKSKNILLV